MINKVFRYVFQKSFIVYGMVGVFVTLVQISLLYLLRNYFIFNDFVSVTTSYIVALILHYFMNKHITFLINERKVFNMMSLRYIMVVMISYLVYITNLSLFTHVFGLTFTLSLIVTLAFNYILNYFLYKKVVFK